MPTATGRISGSAVFQIGEDGDTQNNQSYGLARDAVIECATNSALQIRLDLDDYTADGDEPVIGLALGYTEGTFTVDTGTDVLTTSANHLREVGDEIVLSSTGALPAGSSAGVTYYVLTTPAGNTMTLSETPGGSTLDFTTTGSGTHSFRAFGADSGVQVTFDEYIGGGNPTAAPEVTIKDKRSGERDDFSLIKSFYFALIPTDPAAAASGTVWLTGGVDTDPASYFRIPLLLDAAADSNGCAFACVAVPPGWNYTDTNKLSMKVEECENLTVLIALLGN